MTYESSRTQSIYQVNERGNACMLTHARTNVIIIVVITRDNRSVNLLECNNKIDLENM